MTQSERRKFLIDTLLSEQSRYKDLVVPTGAAEQKQLLRSLMNVRGPGEISRDFWPYRMNTCGRKLQKKG